MADPGFPVGWGANPLEGRQPPTHTLFCKTYAKMKEMDPIGGGERAPPGCANDNEGLHQNLMAMNISILYCLNKRNVISHYNVFKSVCPT